MENTVEASSETQTLKKKMHFTGKVLKTTLAGAIVDIGMEKPGVVHISQLRQDPVRRVEDVVNVGDQVDVWVRRVNDKTGHVELTMIEPLPLEWREIKADMVVHGKVTKLEKFGAFIEIGAERPGLAHISELTHNYIRSVEDAVKVGDEVEAKVLGVDRRKKQIKLSLKALQEDPRSKPVAQEVEEDEDDEPVPTAMEIALRKALDNAEGDQPAQSRGTAKAKRKGAVSNEQEEIISRTLKHKVRTE